MFLKDKKANPACKKLFNLLVQIYKQILQDQFQVSQYQYSHHMKAAASRSNASVTSNSEHYTVTLTEQQASVIQKLLPINYSLHLDIKKRGRKPTKPLPKSPKLAKESIINQSPQPQSIPRHDNTRLNRNQSIQKQPQPKEQQKFPCQTNQQTKQVLLQPIAEKKAPRQKKPSWMIECLKQAQSVPILKKVYGGTFDILFRRFQAKNISDVEYHRTIIRLMTDDRVQKSKRGREIAEQLKKIYQKYEEHVSIVRKKQAKQTKKKQQEIQQQKRRRKKQAESEDDIGIQFSQKQMNNLRKIIDSRPKVDVRFVSYKLGRIVKSEVQQILNKYGLNSFEIQKLQTLSNDDLESLKRDANQFVQNYPQKAIPEPFQDRDASESSFEVEER